MTSPNLLEHLHLAGVKCRFVSVEEAASHRRPPPCWLVVRPFGVPTFDSLFAALQGDLKRQLDRGRLRVLVDYAHEGYTAWMLERLYDALEHADITPDAIHLVSGDECATETHQQVVRERGVRDAINVRTVNYFGALVAELGRSTPRLPRARGTGTSFLCFNRRPRIHRLLLVSRIVRAGLLHLSSVSLPRVFEGRTNWDVLEADGERLGVPARFRRELAAFYGQLDGLLPLIVDNPDVTPNLAYDYGYGAYINSRLSLVTESLFFEGSDRHVFVSEKVYKPLLFGHPLIVFGDPRTLDLLRRQGFETWSPVVDERYDAIDDRAERFEAAWAEVVRLGALSPAEFDERLRAADGSIRHNEEWARTRRLSSSAVDFLFDSTGSLVAGPVARQETAL